MSQEASSRSSSVVTDYVGYLSKGQIPPKVYYMLKCPSSIPHLLPFDLKQLGNCVTPFCFTAHLACEFDGYSKHRGEQIHGTHT
jgi:hypothetical protein